MQESFLPVMTIIRSDSAPLLSQITPKEPKAWDNLSLLLASCYLASMPFLVVPVLGTYFALVIIMTSEENDIYQGPEAHPVSIVMARYAVQDNPWINENWRAVGVTLGNRQKNTSADC